MQISDIFDPNGGHQDEWDKKTTKEKTKIATLQKSIQVLVDAFNTGLYKPTSGWRSVRGNRACGGHPRSRHLSGHARDFVPRSGVCSRRAPKLPDGFRVVRSPLCWHVVWPGR